MQLGGGLMGGLFGGGEYRKAIGGMNRADARLGRMVGQTPFDPYQVSALQRRSIAGDTRALGNRLDNSYGMDIGSGMGGLWSRMLGQQQSMLGQGIMQSKTMGFNRDADLERMRAQMAMARLGAA